MCMGCLSDTGLTLMYMKSLPDAECRVTQTSHSIEAGGLCAADCLDEADCIPWGSPYWTERLAYVFFRVWLGHTNKIDHRGKAGGADICQVRHHHQTHPHRLAGEPKCLRVSRVQAHMCGLTFVWNFNLKIMKKPGRWVLATACPRLNVQKPLLPSSSQALATCVKL